MTLAGLSAKAQAGQGQVCFVTGEAGAGKTALVTEFTRRAQAQHANLLVASGNCSAHTGAGDPYLPFRETLRLLTADVEGRPVTPEKARRLQGFLHEDVGTVLETLYGDGADQVAVQLAHPFQLVGLNGKALRYHLVAGEVAVRNYAAEEAGYHFETANALLGGVPAPDDDHLRLYKGLAGVQFLLGQWDEAMDYLRQRLAFIDAQLDPQDPETRRHRAANLEWMADAYGNVAPETGLKWLAQASATFGEPEDRQATRKQCRSGGNTVLPGFATGA